MAKAKKPDRLKDAAAELGRRGGLKGGRARARALSPERRRAIAKKAIATRWGTKAAPADPRALSELPVGPLEALVMACGRALFARERPGEDWMGLSAAAATGYCRRAAADLGLDYGWLAEAVIRERHDERAERR